MILTVTVPANAAPQTVSPDTGPVIVQPGESLTGEFSDDALAYMWACPGHYIVADGQAASDRKAPQEPEKPRRGRPPKAVR